MLLEALEGVVTGVAVDGAPPLLVPRDRRALSAAREAGSEQFGYEVQFLLRDASGVARVRMDRAQVAVVRDIHTRSGFLDDPTPMEREFLEMQGEDPTGGGGMNRGLRYTEGVIEVGEVVTALGVALPGDDTCRLVIGAPPDGHVLVTDEPTTVHSAARDAH